MDDGPLVNEQIEAEARFLSAFDKVTPVRVAFWLKENDGGRWHLYIVSDDISDENFDLAYGEVIRLANQAQDPDFDPLRVTVLGPHEPLAKAALDVHQRYRGKAMISLRETYFGGVGAEEVYVYP